LDPVRIAILDVVALWGAGSIGRRRWSIDLYESLTDSLDRAGWRRATPDAVARSNRASAVIGSFCNKDDPKYWDFDQRKNVQSVAADYQALLHAWKSGDWTTVAQGESILMHQSCDGTYLNLRWEAVPDGRPTFMCNW